MNDKQATKDEIQLFLSAHDTNNCLCLRVACP